jgi:peptidoglycan/LPS O-acetylase OafA/YrhL
MGFVGITTALLAFVTLFPLALSGRMFSFALTEPAGFVGNGTWQSAVYAFWDSIFAVGMSIGVITLFRRFFNAKTRFGSFLSLHSYTVYIIHTPIIVFVAIALKGIQLTSMLKFGLAAIIVTPICFAVAYIVRKLPLASKIL